MSKQADINAQILALLAREDSPKGIYGLDIVIGIGRPPATIGPNLARLGGSGYIEARWQDEEMWPQTRRQAPAEPARPEIPRKRYYRITPQGRKARTEWAAATPKGRRAASPVAKPQTA